jgi:hypothetical protein
VVVLGPDYSPGLGIYYQPRNGTIRTDLECLQYLGLRCEDSILDWGEFGPPSAALSGWSPLEYLAGMSPEGARNTLRLLEKFQAGRSTGDWLPYLLDAGPLTAKAGLEGSAVIGGIGALSLGARMAGARTAARGPAPVVPSATTPFREIGPVHNQSWLAALGPGNWVKRSTAPFETLNPLGQAEVHYFFDVASQQVAQLGMKSKFLTFRYEDDLRALQEALRDIVARVRGLGS